MRSLFWGERKLTKEGERDLMDSPTFYARRGSTELSEYIGGLVARKETYKFQDADG